MRSLRKEWWSAGLLLAMLVQMQSLYADSGEHKSSTSPNHRTVRTNQTVRVIIWAREVGKGSVVQSEDFEQMEMPVSKCPVDAIDDTSIAEGRTTIQDTKKGDAIRLRDFGIKLLPNSPARTTYLGREDIPLPVLYSGKSIPEGSVLKLQDLEIRKVRFSKIPPHALVSPYSALGRTAFVDIAKGKILFDSDVGLECREIAPKHKERPKAR